MTRGSSSPVFRKDLPYAPRSYPAEAAGLRWLAAAGPHAARVVGVRGVTADYLELDRLSPARPTAAAASAFGAALARTHAVGAIAFGAPPDGWSGAGFIGRQPMSMDPTDHWGQFFAEQRLLPYARAARDRGHLSLDGARAVDRVADRLQAGEFDDDRPPARIHGDLWSGNVLFTAGGVVLIDPAAHGGHGLTDLAMLALFGAPQLDQITAAYATEAELDSGWTELISLHQLHPLLVHAVTHGAAYGVEAERIAREYG